MPDTEVTEQAVGAQTPPPGPPPGPPRRSEGFRHRDAVSLPRRREGARSRVSSHRVARQAGGYGNAPAVAPARERWPAPASSASLAITPVTSRGPGSSAREPRRFRPSPGSTASAKSGPAPSRPVQTRCGAGARAWPGPRTSARRC
jgi:hypothetical protein